MVVTNAVGGESFGLDQTFITTQPPAIDGALLGESHRDHRRPQAQVNPNGLETTYRFEYGPDLLRPVAPVPDGSITAGERRPGDRSPPRKPDRRTSSTTTAWSPPTPTGRPTANDHTFNFYPPSCPNENVRQQTQANYLPDCRAYELVSPGDAGGHPALSGRAQHRLRRRAPRASPSPALWSTIPDSGGSPIDSNGDLYVATRTDTGWVTKYVGLPANQAAVDGGPADGPAESPGDTGFHRASPAPVERRSTADKIQNNVLTDPGMNTFLDWNDGNQAIGS